MNIEDVIVPILVIAALAFCAASTLFIQTKESKKERGDLYDIDTN